MKKLFTTVLFAAVAACGFSQAPPPSPCTPTLTTAANGAIVPDTIVNLPVAHQASLYSAVLQVFVPAETLVAPLPNPLPIQYFKLNSIVGLPSEFIYASNPANDTFPGGTAACLLLTSETNLVTSAQGTYPLTVNVTARVTTLFGPQSQNSAINGYKLVIDGPVAVITRDVTTFGVLSTFPNPATDNTTIEFGSANSSNVTLNVYNSIGSLVFSNKINATAGSNFTTVNTNSFANGNYIYTLNNGTNVINGKFSVAK